MRWAKIEKKTSFWKKQHFAGISFSYSFSKLFLAAQWWNVMNSMCYKKYVIYGAAVGDWGVAHWPGQMMEAKQVAWFKSSTRPGTWHKVLQNTSIREVVTNRPTDRPTDGPTDQRTNGWANRWTEPLTEVLCSTWKWSLFHFCVESRTFGRISWKGCVCHSVLVPVHLSIHLSVHTSTLPYKFIFQIRENALPHTCAFCRA